MKTFLFSRNKKITALLAASILLMSVGCASFPSTAHASDADSPVQVAKDIGSFLKNTVTAAATSQLQVKELALDPIAWAVSKMAIQTMTKSVVNWINSGFNGSPAFVTDLKGHLQNVADSVAGNFLNQLASDPALKSPFQSKIAQAVGSLYYLSTSKNSFTAGNFYTLSQASSNDSAFLNGNFEQGGWSAWLSTIMSPQNNPLGAKMIAQQELNRLVDSAQSTALTQLNWGQGFLSWCGTDRSGSNSNANAPTDGIDQVVVTSAVNPAEVCQNKDGSPGFIQTPGSVIQNQVNKTLGLSGDQLVSADEFNEIIGALMSQLVSQVLGGGGLSGVSSASSGGNGYIDQAASSTQYTNPINNSNAQAALAQNVTAEEQQMTQYKIDWQSIQSEGQTAAAKVSGCSFVSDTLTKATVEEGRADTTTTALKKILAELTASGATGTPTIDTMNAELTALLANPTTPSATDIAYASEQSSGSGSTLMTKLMQIASSGLCFAL